MSEQTQAILTVYAKAYEQVMLNSLPSVTGKTKASVSSEVTPNRMRGFARGFIHATETGRGPRKSATYSEYDQNLEGWMKAKGFPTKKSKSGVTYYQIGQSWFSAKSLAWKINAKGDKTFRTGGKEVFSDKLDALIAELTDKIESQKHKEYTDELMNQLGTLSNKTP